jgi:hypothetical protein
MANSLAIHAIGHAMVTHLRESYPTQIARRPLPDCSFELLSSLGMNGEPARSKSTRIGLYLYRLTINGNLRPPASASPANSSKVPLELELHFLLTAWGATPEQEQIPLAWAISLLHACPILDTSILPSEAGWKPDELLQVVPAPISVEQEMHIWSSIKESQRPSMAYVVRGLRLDIPE